MDGRVGATYLLDATMTGSGTNVGEIELTDVDLSQSFRRGDLTRVGRQNPVDLNRLTEEDVGRENADLLDLTFEGEREGSVCGSGDVGLVDVQYRGV